MSEDSALVACKAPGERLRIVELSPSSDSTRWAEYARRAPGLWERVSWGSVPESGEPADVARDLLTGGGVVPDAIEMAGDLAITALSPRDASEEAVSLAAILGLMDPSVRDESLREELPLGVEPPRVLANLERVDAALEELAALPQSPARVELASPAGAIRLELSVEGTGFAEDGVAGAVRTLSASPPRTAYADREGRMLPSPAPLPSEADALAALRMAMLSLLASIERERERLDEEGHLARREEPVPLCHETARTPQAEPSSWHVHSDESQDPSAPRRQGGIS